jgi:hypothetical protein
MNRFFRKYQEWVLFATAFVFTVSIILFFVWGTRLLITQFDAAFATQGATVDTSDFRSIDARQILEARGLL